MTCPISNQIAKHCDEPEQESAWEKYRYLLEWNHVRIKDDVYFYDDITELLDSDKYETATDDETTKLYIDKIAELMND